MRQSIRIAGQIRRSLFSEGWHGPAVFEVLHGLTAADAGRVWPVATHSVWEMVRHMTVWQEAGFSSLHGKTLPPHEEAVKLGWEDLGEISEEAWGHEKRRLRESGDRLAARTATLDDKRLETQVAGRPYDIAHLLLGIASHNIYHCGQIVLLHRHIHLNARP